jgi:hypothetical protein
LALELKEQLFSERLFSPVAVQDATNFLLAIFASADVHQDAWLRFWNLARSVFLASFRCAVAVVETDKPGPLGTKQRRQHLAKISGGDALEVQLGQQLFQILTPGAGMAAACWK